MVGTTKGGIASLALLHCLELPYWHYQLLLSWYLHQPESHQLSFNKVSDGVTDGHPDPKIGPQGYLGPIKIYDMSSEMIYGHGVWLQYWVRKRLFGEVCITWGLSLIVNWQQFTLCDTPGHLGNPVFRWPGVSLCIQITSVFKKNFLDALASLAFKLSVIK